jgi:undecaprenyl-diphosphatase
VSIIEAIILGIVQGLTEFIPVSSSGHLVIMHDVLGVETGGLTFDVALHVGTLLALVIYFYRDIASLAGSVWRRGTESHLVRMLALATVPAVISGVLLQAAAETTFRSSQLVAFNLMAFGAVMLAAERFGRRAQPGDINKIKPWQAVFIGLAQAVAIIPGVSRSGSTISAGLLLGFDRVAATRFAFLLAVPITFGATVKVFMDGAAIGLVRDESGIFIVGTLVAFASGLLAIRFLLKFLAKHSLAAFAYYRFIVGGAVLLLLSF